MNSRIKNFSDFDIFSRAKLSKADAARALGISRHALQNRLVRRSNAISSKDWIKIARYIQAHKSDTWERLVFLLEEYEKTDISALRIKIPSGIPGVVLSDFAPRKIVAIIPNFFLFHSVEHDCFEQLANEIKKCVYVDFYILGQNVAEELLRSLLGWKDMKKKHIEQFVIIRRLVEPLPCPFIFQINPQDSLQMVYLTAMLNQYIKAEQTFYSSMFATITSFGNEDLLL